MRSGKSVNKPASDIFFTDRELPSATLHQGIEDCAPTYPLIIEIVVKVSGTDKILRQDQRPLEGVPDRECPVAHKLAEAVFSPFFVGRRHDRDEKWGKNCFCKLMGDWALSIWNPLQRSLILAKDFIGARHLYYYFDDKGISWCTILDPLVKCGGRKFAICEEYIACWLINRFPAPHVTPYVGVQAVPPSCFVQLRPGGHGTMRRVTRYWDFDPDNRICYRSDTEYQEHFRSVFGTAVQRCLRSDRPVLAELSGGMDSSSIVDRKSTRL